MLSKLDSFGRGFAIAALLAAPSVVGIVPAFAQTSGWQAKQDGRYIATASASGPAIVLYPSKAEATVNVRLDWSEVAGVPVESYRFQWDVAEPVELLRPFANRLPAEGDISRFPNARESLGNLRSTDVALQVQFTLRAPKRSVKKDTFFTDCDASYCYVKGMRNLDTGTLQMGTAGTWHSKLSPSSPPGQMLGTWLGGCLPLLECQANTLRTGTDIRIDRVIVSKLSYDVEQATSVLRQWADVAQEESTELAEFRAELYRLTAPRQGTEPDPEIRAGADLIHYSGMLNEMTPMRGRAEILDWRASETGRGGSTDRYYREWQEALRKIEALYRQSKVELDQARQEKAERGPAPEQPPLSVPSPSRNQGQSQSPRRPPVDQNSDGG